MAQNGKLDEAKKLLAKAEGGIDPENLPYAMVSRFNSHNQTGLMYLEAAYKAGNMELAEKVRQNLRKDLEDQKKYYQYLESEKPEYYEGTMRGTEAFLNDVMLQVLDAIEKAYAPGAKQNNTIETGPATIQSNKDTVPAAKK
jgi:hypothetical protein